MVPHFASEESDPANAFEPSIASHKNSVLNSVISIIESLIIANDVDGADSEILRAGGVGGRCLAAQIRTPTECPQSPFSAA